MTATSTLTRARTLAAAALASTALVAGCSAGSGTAEPTPTAGSGTGEGAGDGTGHTGSGAGDGDGSTGTDGGTTPGGSEETVRVGLVAEPASLDFTTSSGAAIPQVMMDNVYETLVTIDEGEIVPGLAESWEVSEDRTTYTFTLSDGVTFSNGSEFTAEDAKFSIERVSTDAWTNGLAAKLDVVESVEAPDDTTVVVTLSRPSNQFLFNLTTLVGAMFDSEGVHDLANDPIGTGPYVFESWDRGSMITLTRHEDYHGDAPYFQTVEMRYFRDGNALNNAMLTDAIDVVATVQAPEALMEFEGGAYQIIEGTTNGEIVLSMNQQEGNPLSDLRLRQAVRHAIDHQSLMDTCWAGKGVLIGSMVPPTDPWYEDRTGDYPFDQDRARDLIEEAGAGGTTLRLRIPTLPYAVACGTVVESMLEEVGLDVTIDELEFPSAWLETVFTNKDYDLSIVSHVEGRDMAAVFGNPDYYTTYGTEDLQALLEAADSGSEEQEITKMHEAARLISEDAAADFLFLLPNLMVAEPDITGLPENILAESFPLADLARD
ncbi:ABC transporter substrate-binding protein [Ornithinimicrobium pratense]|uniref:ABC transporter substrate-binding protein n=1 Tax=Ornithinimicrobium pratense TaxID=2593973 RepID=A0A5J6V776_9MICO|nr:ABC transporter substrate-binding protein [Ornithinimicrobium pratense]QFG69675.1 ABC transporter substrate-binding protein [Ornithinimicrobium pratense]